MRLPTSLGYAIAAAVAIALLAGCSPQSATGSGFVPRTSGSIFLGEPVGAKHKKNGPLLPIEPG